MNIQVLYVEDDNFSIEQLGRYFSRYAPDFQFTIAERASTALRFLQQQEFDVILLDFVLPDGNALDVVREVHATGLIVPIVVITGNDQEELLTSVLRAGASDYLVKRGEYIARLPRILRALAKEYRLQKRVLSRVPSS